MDRKIETNRTRKWVFIALGILVTASFSAVFIYHNMDGGRILRVGAERLSIAPVIAGQYEDFIPIRGHVTPAKTLYLDAIEGGRVEKIHVEDGAELMQGALIVTLSNAALQLDVISREAQITEQLNNAQTLELQLEQNRIRNKRDIIEANYQVKRLTRQVIRNRDLAAGGHVSAEQLEQSEDELDYWQNLLAVRREGQDSNERLQKAQLTQIKSAVSSLQANLAIARQNLDNLSITAPTSGQLTAFDLEVGQSVERGERVGQIDSPNDFKLSALIDEFYIHRIQVGQAASVEINGQQHPLTVHKIYSEVRSGQFEVDLQFASLVPGNIRRGQSLSGRLSLGDAEEAVIIPNGAFFLDTGGTSIFVVTPGGETAERRSIRVGRRNPRQLEVLSGLMPGEQVVVSTYTNFKHVNRLEFN